MQCCLFNEHDVLHESKPNFSNNEIAPIALTNVALIVFVNDVCMCLISQHKDGAKKPMISQ